MNPAEPDRNNPSDAAARRVESLAQAGGTSRAERWLRSLVQNSSDIIAIYEDDGTVRYMNSSVERILGYKPEELVGTSAFNHVHPEDVESASRSLYEALENGGVMPPVELRIQAADGSWRHMEMLLNNLLDDPDVGGIVANSRDITERKDAYERLAESERRFSTVVSNAHAYVYRCRNEPGLPHEFASDYAVELTGYPPEDLLVGGKVRFGDLIVEEDRDKVWWEIHKALPQRRAFQVRYAIRRRDGEVRYLEDHGQGVYDEDGEVVALDGLIYDVTGLVRAEARLRESEERYRTLVEQIPAVTYIDRADGSDEPLYTSPQIEEMLGYTPEEWLEGRLWPERLHPDDRERVLDADERFESGDEPFSEEYRLLAMDGRVVWVREEAVLVRNEESEPLFWQGVIFDITERKEAEEAIERLAHRNQLILNSAGEGIYGLDREGRTTFVNPAAAALTGYEPDELVGEHQHDIVHHSRPDGTAYPKEECPIYSVLRDGEVQRVDDEVFWRKDGTSFPVEYTSTPIQEDGEVVGAVVTFTDVTERKRAEEALKESEERYRALMEQSVEAIYLYDAETKRVLESNAAFRELIGYSEEELLGLQIYDFIDHGRENIDANIRRSLREKRRHIGERRYRCKDGSVIIVDTSASVITHNGMMALCAVSRDITERKRAEEVLKESEERFRSLIRNASDVITILEADGIVRYDSPAIERVLGYRPEERVGKSAFEYIHPDDVERVKRTFTEAVDESGVQPPVEFRIRHKDGSWRHVEVIRSNLLDDPLVRGVVANSRDITERKEAEEALAEERNLLRTLIDNMPDFIFVKDVESRFVINNAEHLRVLGATQQGEVIGKTDFDVFSRHLAERYYADEREVVKSGRPLIDREEPVTASDGNERWLSTTKVPLRDSTGRISGLVGISRDITERRVLEEQLKHQAFHDPLTALPNRALFLDRLGHALARSRRLGKPVAVLFVDLDDFKLVNDSLGHEKGDLLLVEVAERLASCVRPGDTVARIFGDEFGVLLEPPTGVDDARRVAERMQERLQEPFGLDGREMFVSSSVGITIGEPDDRDADQYRPEDLLRRADLAMYVAKRRGKNRCEAFSPSMDARVSERMELENDLRRAIEREEFAVHYQPIVELRTGRIKGLEALARWRHPERGLLDAEEFVWFAEETGLIRPIGQWVFEEVCRQAHRWNERHPDNRRVVSVNFSVSQFAHQADLIPKVLSDTGLDPRALVIEITERAVMDDAEFALGELRRLKDLGVSFGIDDYGTGYSCLSYLKLMPVDFLKIDRSFIAGLGEDPGDEAIVSGTIDLAHALGLRVVAEGVETADQLRWLKEHGCDLAQGGYLFKPLAEGEIPALGR